MKDIIRPHQGQRPKFEENNMVKRVHDRDNRHGDRKTVVDDNDVINGTITKKDGILYGEEGVTMVTELRPATPIVKRSYKDILVYALLGVTLIVGNGLSGLYFIPNGKCSIFMIIFMGSLIFTCFLINVLCGMNVINCPCGNGCYKKSKE